LKYNEDPDAARRALEVIRSRMPGTHLARMAEYRMAQIPNSVEELREQQINKPVYLPALHDPLDQEKTDSMPVATPTEAIQRAVQLDKRLEADPADILLPAKNWPAFAPRRSANPRKASSMLKNCWRCQINRHRACRLAWLDCHLADRRFAGS